MVAILFRTIVIYLLLVGTMRLMGKRQIGELELSELVTTLLLSEIAALPITNHEIPVMFAVIPIITLLSLEVLLSVLLVKFPAIKNLITPRPNLIINKGVLQQKELKRLRMSTDELFCELRQAGIADISDVYYATIEENGKLSVIQRTCARQPSNSQMGLTIPESGISHILISDGKLNSYGLERVGVSRGEVDAYLSANRCVAEDVFLLLRDDGGKYTIIMKETGK